MKPLFSSRLRMVEWSVAANRAETGWLASKMDTMEDRLSIRIQLVQDEHFS